MKIKCKRNLSASLLSSDVAKPHEPKSLLPQREVEICQRAQAVRLALKVGQPDFANELGIPRGRLAAYEYLKAPIRFPLGYALCQRFNLSLKWLALGQGSQTPFTPFSKGILDAIGNRELFSAVYDKMLAKDVEARLTALKNRRADGSVTYDNRRLGVPLAQSHFEQVHDFVAFAATQMPEEKKLHFSHKLNDLAFAFFPWESAGKPMVDIQAASANLPGMASAVPTWKQLVQELKRLTKSPGAKAQLAVELKTSRQNVNKWLSGAGAPSADLVLEVLRWVTDPKRKSPK